MVTDTGSSRLLDDGPLGRPAAPAVPRPVRQAAARTGSAGDTLLCLLLAAYLLSLALEGVLRYAMALRGLQDLLYARDAIPPASIAALWLRALLRDGRIDMAITVPSAVLLAHAAWSLMLGMPRFQIAFGLKIYMFVPYGIAMWPLVRERLPQAWRFAAGLFGVTAAGVFANALLGPLPWQGLDYQTAFGLAATSREWWTGEGTARLAGFTRTSFNAAMVAGITGVLCMAGLRHAGARLAVAAVGLAAIYFTTSKGMILAFSLAALWLLVHERLAVGGVRLVALVAGTTLVLPVVMVFFQVAGGHPGADLPLFLTSAWERFTLEWPRAFELLPDGPHAVLGAGVGSIGTPQAFSELPLRLSPGDNVAVYVLVTFGLPGLAYYAAPVLLLRRIMQTQPPVLARAATALLVVAYGYGVSINMVEDSFHTICLGLCVGCGIAALGQRRATR